MKKIYYLFTSMAIVCVVLLSCDPASEADDVQILQNEQVSNDATFWQEISAKNHINSKRPQPLIWADCWTYSGIVVPATFKPNSNAFDELYAMPEATFKDGVPLISGSKPGDVDYHGGRWHLNVLKDGVSPDKYMEACKEEDLDLNDFMSTANYFGCPLRPRR